MTGERVLHGGQIPKWSRGPRTWTSAEETEDINGVRCAPDDTAVSFLGPSIRSYLYCAHHLHTYCTALNVVL